MVRVEGLGKLRVAGVGCRSDPAGTAGYEHARAAAAARANFLQAARPQRQHGCAPKVACVQGESTLENNVFTLLSELSADSSKSLDFLHHSPRGLRTARVSLSRLTAQGPAPHLYREYFIKKNVASAERGHQGPCRALPCLSGVTTSEHLLCSAHASLPEW